jgi:hypothetical protein
VALKTLNENLARARVKPKAKPLPRVDDTSERVVKAIEDAHTDQNRETLSVLQKLVDKDISIELDAAAVGAAVGKEIRKMPAPVVKMPERKPLSYKATIQRNREGHMISAQLDPILEK